jgi:hypothetical protein
VTDTAPGAYFDVITNGVDWVAVSFFGEIVVTQQPDAWTQVRDPGLGGSIRAVAVDSSRWAITGWDGAKGVILTSTDLIAWTRRAETLSLLNDLTTDDNLWVAVGTGGTILTSADGLTWTAQSSGVPDGLAAVALS